MNKLTSFLLLALTVGVVIAHEHGHHDKPQYVTAIVQPAYPGQALSGPRSEASQQGSVVNVHVPIAKQQEVSGESNKPIASSPHADYAAAVEELKKSHVSVQGAREAGERPSTEYGGFQPILYGTLRQVSHADHAEERYRAAGGNERDYEDGPINLEVNVEQGPSSYEQREKHSDERVRDGSDGAKYVRGSSASPGLDFLSELDDEAILDLIARNSDYNELVGKSYPNAIAQEPNIADLASFENLGQLQGLFDPIAQASAQFQQGIPAQQGAQGGGHRFPGLLQGAASAPASSNPFSAIAQQLSPNFNNFKIPQIFPQLGGNLANLFGSQQAQQSQAIPQFSGANAAGGAGEDKNLFWNPFAPQDHPNAQPALGFPTHDVSGLKFNVPYNVAKNVPAWNDGFPGIRGSRGAHAVQQQAQISPSQSQLQQLLQQQQQFNQFAALFPPQFPQNFIPQQQPVQTQAQQSSPAANAAAPAKSIGSSDEPVAAASSLRPKWLKLVSPAKAANRLKSWVTSFGELIG